MKTTLTKVLSILSFCAFAQAPQGFTYQAVATDNNGLELVEQNISVRVSILSESSTGVEQWIETHSTTTDGFGLFTITIGEGTSTGNGVQSSFSDIDWGGSEHYLKIEMDVDGGSEYQLLGISQLMSVPYALYAESSGTPGPEGPEGPPGEPAAPVDYDSLVTILSADSSFTANFSGGIGGVGCDILYPDGLDGSVLNIHTTNSETYTVPSGKTFYILNARLTSDGTGGSQCTMYIDGKPYVEADDFVGADMTNPIPVGSGSVISVGGGMASYNGYFNGILINEGVQINNIHTTNSETYTVPSGKTFYILNARLTSDGTGGSQCTMYIDGKPYVEADDFVGADMTNPIPVGSGSVISVGGGMASYNGYFNGYLVDENYFANCGGGSNSESSSEDNAEYTNFTKINANQNDSTLISAVPNKSIIITGSISSCYPEWQTIDIIFEDEAYNVGDNIKGAGWIMPIENGSSINPSNLFSPLDDLPGTTEGWTRKFYYEFEVSHPMDIIIYSTNSCGSSSYLIQY